MPEACLIYFAYGSNMLTSRIRDRRRCPSAKVLGMAELRGYKLRWHKKSSDGSGKCDIIGGKKPDISVFGVLYEISSSEKENLDKAEGLGAGYEEIEVEVLFGLELVKAIANKATKINPVLRPYSWYRELVVAGAKEHGLPPDYIARLESVSATEDHDRNRHRSNISLIARVCT